MQYLTPIVRPNCPVCDSDYKGGAFVPGQRFKPGFRVFYSCGCCVSLPKDYNDEGNKANGNFLLITNCFCERNLYGEKALSDYEQIRDQEPKEFDQTTLNKKFEDGTYFIIEEDDREPHLVEIDMDQEKEVKINRGRGVIVLCTSKEKAKEFIGNYEDLSCRKLTKKTIIAKYSKRFSHAIIDPIHYQEGESYIVKINNALLTKIK